MASDKIEWVKLTFHFCLHSKEFLLSSSRFRHTIIIYTTQKLLQQEKRKTTIINKQNYLHSILALLHCCLLLQSVLKV